jgi:hypothetical protein
MRTTVHKPSNHSSSNPVYTFDTDESLSRVIRDPMAVLLCRSSLSLQRDTVHTDPYNRVGRALRLR